MSTAEELTLWSSLARDHGTSRTMVDPESRQWQDEAGVVLEELARSGTVFSAEDIYDRMSPAPSDGAMGAVFLRASKSGRIVNVGITRAKRVSRHAGVVRTWRGREWEP
jgi:hypothetical protein